MYIVVYAPLDLNVWTSARCIIIDVAYRDDACTVRQDLAEPPSLEASLYANTIGATCVKSRRLARAKACCVECSYSSGSGVEVCVATTVFFVESSSLNPVEAFTLRIERMYRCNSASCVWSIAVSFGKVPCLKYSHSPMVESASCMVSALLAANKSMSAPNMCVLTNKFVVEMLVYTARLFAPSAFPEKALWPLFV